MRQKGETIKNPRTVGSFQAGPPPVMYILEDVSELTVFHEIVHIKIWKTLSEEEMANLHIIEEEIMVWEEIWKSKVRWANKELTVSYEYVLDKIEKEAKGMEKENWLKRLYNQEMNDLIWLKKIGIR